MQLTKGATDLYLKLLPRVLAVHMDLGLKEGLVHLFIPFSSISLNLPLSSLLPLSLLFAPSMSFNPMPSYLLVFLDHADLLLADRATGHHRSILHIA